MGGSGNRRIFGTRFEPNTLREFEFGEFYVKDLQTGNILLQGSGAPLEFEGIGTITLNNYNNARMSRNRWYYVKLFKAGKLAFDGVPCYRKSDNKPGMYDLVSRAFLTNLGAGVDFIIGPDV